jgi:hypothetical protein
MNKLLPLFGLVAAGIGIAWIANRPSKMMIVRPGPVAPGYATAFEAAYKRYQAYLALDAACSTRKDVASCTKAESERQWLAINYPKLLAGKTANPCRVISGKVVCSGGR